MLFFLLCLKSLHFLNCRRLFFSVSNEDVIYSAKMDGSGVQVTIKDANRPTS